MPVRLTLPFAQKVRVVVLPTYSPRIEGRPPSSTELPAMPEPFRPGSGTPRAMERPPVRASVDQVAGRPLTPRQPKATWPALGAVSKPPLATNSTAAAAATLMVCGCEAGAKVAFPAWLAVTVQEPAATKVNVVPLTVHTLGVLEAKVTARPELADALSAAVVPAVWLPSGTKVTVCVVRETVKVRLTLVAGKNDALPACEATTMQSPWASSVNVVPVTVHTVGVVLAKVTGRPELALAVSAPGSVPKVWLTAGPVKVMVCAAMGAGATVCVLVTLVAAAKVPLPAWLAVTEQVPAATKVSVLPLTVHTAGVVLA